jgi:hypothetical protein
MGICLLCNVESSILYGDDKYGKIFCYKCNEECSCAYCKELNIEIYIYDTKKYNNKNNYDIIIYEFYGRLFKLYCKECFKSKEMYKEKDEFKEGLEEYIPKIELKRMKEDEDNGIDTYEETEEGLDAYYVRRGKYDLY